MKILRDIICSKTNYNEMYNPNESCIGTIMVNDNDTFEGIMMDGERKEEIFIFGKLNDEVIEVVRATSSDEQLPRSYEASLIDGKYRGEYKAKTAYYEYPVGECQISIIDPYWYRESSSGEELFIESHKVHHIRNMSKDSKELYRKIMIEQKTKNKHLIKQNNK